MTDKSMKELRKIYDSNTQWSVEEMTETDAIIKLKKNGVALAGYQEVTIDKTHINTVIEMLQQFRKAK